MSPIVSALLVYMKLPVDKIQQAAEAELNNRKQVGEADESGLRNMAKDMRANSSATFAFTQNISAVTAFIQHAQADVGTVDKLAAKAAKLGCEPVKLATIPATLHKHDVGAWLAKFGNGKVAKPATAVKAVKPAPVAKVAPVATAFLPNPVLA